MANEIGTIRALNNHLLIEPLSNETVTKSGIIIPEKVQKRKPRKGLVRIAYEGAPVKVGESILYPTGHGTEVTLRDTDGKDKIFEILPDEDVMLII